MDRTSHDTKRRLTPVLAMLVVLTVLTEASCGLFEQKYVPPPSTPMPAAEPTLD